jgi:hypothetical protein
MTIWCESCGDKNMTAENVPYPDVDKRSSCNKCKPCSDWCKTGSDCSGNNYNKGNRPKNIPVFNTTYVGRAKRHIPIEYFDYYDCTKQRGGTCGSVNNNIATNEFKSKCSAGRCELVCETFDSANDKTLYKKEQKNAILKFNNNYTGSSKKTEYARYIKRTRGTETFASKKITSTQVKNRVNCQLEQFPTYCSNNLNRFPFTVVPSSYKDTSTSV